MAVPGLQQRSLTKSGIQAPPPGRAVLCPRPSGCRHPPVLTQHSAVFARVQEPRMAQKPAPTRKSRCAPWVEQTFEKNRALLAVLAERSEAVAPIGAWVECPSPCGEEAPASVSASQLEEEFKEQQRLKEEALKRFQEQVKNRVNQQVRLRKKQQLQKSFEAVEKESTVAMQSSSLAPHLTPKGRANIFQSNLKSAIRSFDSNLPIQTLGDIEKKEEDENGAFQQQALALSQTLKQARQQLASRKTIDGEKPLGFSEDSMESSPTQEIALLRQPTSLRTGERGRKDSPLKDHPDQLLPAQASIRDQAEQKEEEREQQKKTCIRQLSAVSANGKRIEKPLPYHISGKIQAQETAENTNFGQLVTVSADGKETEKLLPYHLPDKVQAQETAEKPYFGQLLAAGSDDEETEKSLPYHILGNIQAQETAEIFTVDTTSEGRSKTFPVESYREQGVPYADVREEKKKPHFGLELSAVGADGKETERPLPYYIPGNIQSQETAEKSYFGQPLTVGTNGKRSEKPLPYHIPGKVQTQETEEKPFFGQLSTVGADGKGTEKPFPYHIPGKVQFQETAEKPYFGQLSIVGADGKGTEKPFPYHIPGKVQAQETAEKPYFGQLSTVGADGKGTEKPFPYHIPGKVQAQETAEKPHFGQLSAVGADGKGTEKPLSYHIQGKIQAQETAEVYGGPQSGSRSEFQNLPLFECGIDQEEDKKARQKQYLRYRRLFMDIERQQVKELERQRKFRKKIERVKKWKEQQRCIEEQKILRKTCQEDLDSGVKTCEISADSKLEDKKGAIKKHQRSRECIRYIEALRAQIQEKMRLYNIDLPPLCCCGPDFWDAHPDTCANNCIFYKNHQAYTQALHSVISSCEISENNSSMRLAIHNFASARRRNWKIQ
ncbi:coiled-coil domain-containing protein 15 isoform X3 [Monodelphis domestica]|uniref:coiled-coil domain-containing protein 15 isoform X3 n=1 Tax=Monodelphis domestica TaxID=13616 RepID=UPI0024E1A29B|nr:coiled-coil domain-containing protein 15 isoform X3 [Monodelphis domestica]